MLPVDSFFPLSAPVAQIKHLCALVSQSQHLVMARQQISTPSTHTTNPTVHCNRCIVVCFCHFFI